eukprot:Skav212790  [mRNA]  locus=scaffold159:459575:461167:- [translate_table: standard]
MVAAGLALSDFTSPVKDMVGLQLPERHHHHSASRQAAQGGCAGVNLRRTWGTKGGSHELQRFIVGQSSTLAIVLTICFAMLNGASFLTDNILGLVIDYDELRTGTRSEATFTMFASFIPKVAAAAWVLGMGDGWSISIAEPAEPAPRTDSCQVVSVPASAFPLTLLALMGFRDPIDGQLQVQTDTVQWGVRRLGR